MSSLQLRIASKKSVAQDVCSFELVREDGLPLPAFTAGAHIDVKTPSGHTRQYSLCNTPNEKDRYLIAVKKEASGRGGSRSMHEEVQEGDILVVSEPRNHFQLIEGAKRHLLLAAGIGITPILSMANQLAAIGENFELHYSAKAKGQAAFHEQLATGSISNCVYFHFSADPLSSRIDFSKVLAVSDDDTHLYVCGPKDYIDSVLMHAKSCGWKESQLHYELFAGTINTTNDDADFEVQIARTGQVISVPASQTILQALREAAIEVSSSCEQGICGSCLTTVLEGTPDHRDMYLTESEKSQNTQVIVCCSRSKTVRLVLDL